MNGHPGAMTLGFNEPLIFDRSVPGRDGASLPRLDVPQADPEQLFTPALCRK